MTEAYDAVVVGGGVGGAATAFHLERLGCGRVLLVERDQTCSGGTAKSCAIARADDKSQIQALDRTQALLPLRPGQVERCGHDYKRHVTTSLFTALDVATGKIIGQCFPRHRSREFHKVLGRIEANVADDLDIHIVTDNDVTHKTKPIRDWFAIRPRWHVHFTPTSASGLNQVERFFALLTEKQLRRGVHRSTHELERAILDLVNITNENHKPFEWTKSADDILAAIQRFCLGTLETAEQQTKIHQTSESGP